MCTPLISRMARQAADDSRAGNRATFTRYTHLLRGPLLRRFTECYYTMLTAPKGGKQA